jgi:ElaB/YqjD/DUF883 family membrane-anchored ribosome-binding protein
LAFSALLARRSQAYNGRGGSRVLSPPIWTSLRERSSTMSRISDTSTNTGNQGGSEGSGIGDTASQVSQNIREMGSQVRDMASEKYSQLRDQATDYYQQGRDRAQQWEESFESYVQEKPVQAVLMAAGIGVLLGLLWRRH